MSHFSLLKINRIIGPVAAYSWWGNENPYRTNLCPVMHTALRLVMKSSSVQPEDLGGGQQEVEDLLVRELGPTPQL